MKKCFLVCMVALLALSATDALAQKLTKMWDVDMSSTHTVSEARAGMAAWGKQAILPNKTSGKIEVWEAGVLVKEYDINTWATAQGLDCNTLGLGVATDEKGNIVCNLGFGNATSSQNFVVIPADGSDWFYLPVEIPSPATATRMEYLGNIAGDIVNGNAYMFLCPSGSEYIAVVKVQKRYI